MAKQVIIIDDDLDFSRSLGENIELLGFRVLYAQTGSDAVSEIARENVQLVLLDIILGHEDGLEVLRSIRRASPSVPVIMITGFASIATAVQAMKLGAVDYIQKPINIAVLSKLIDNAASVSTAQRTSKEADERQYINPPNIVTEDPVVLELMRKAERIAKTDLPVLICGENGTGKELIANFVHEKSTRSSRAFVKVNCSAFPETLLDNELFGHERGAYTGADSTFHGVFEKSNKGTLFLDEIGDMAPSIQAKILRTLENHEIRRIGGNETIQVDVRFITATNRDIRKMIGERTFREDLFYRLNAAILHIPPLRARKEDIPLLVEEFLNSQTETWQKRLRVGSEVLRIFLAYSWPGNVRELKNTVSYAASMAEGEVIKEEDLPPALIYGERGSANDAQTSLSLAEMERVLIAAVLRDCNNNRTRAAETLNISRNTLYNKMRKYGLVDIG